MIPKIINGDKSVDDRGIVSYINKFKLNDVKRFYQITNHKIGFVRAWHGHRNESKFLLCNSGSFRIGAVDLETEEIYQFYLTCTKPQVLFIPSGYANGIQNLTDENLITVFSTSSIEESLDDDIRFDWDKWNIWQMEDYR